MSIYRLCPNYIFSGFLNTNTWLVSMLVGFAELVIANTEAFLESNGNDHSTIQFFLLILMRLVVWKGTVILLFLGLCNHVLIQSHGMNRLSNSRVMPSCY